ncbi:hypothetical protein IP91_00885 [Pseudoduganella lurida]|uniref:Uncharacterized protein n=1 Tax=Pseudoduganella lurida TaxID=1036180 RepID=A0A562RL89_9BURK|nr:hypothetical protein [Pseudoduganella lurida]TWI69812.1 hypothetical protein IP91_00885 [Pseudoduganella lurida]
MWLDATGLESASDYAGFFGSLIAALPPLRSSWIYYRARGILLAAQRSPGSVSDIECELAETAIGKAAHFTRFDMGCMGGGFVLLLVSFACKILSKL